MPLTFKDPFLEFYYKSILIEKTEIQPNLSAKSTKKDDIMNEDDNSSKKDGEIPMLRSLESAKDENFCLNRDDGNESTNDEINTSIFSKSMCGLNLELPSLKARPECGALTVDTTGLDSRCPEWQDMSVSDSYDDFDPTIHQSFYNTTTPTATKKMLKLDETKTPRAGLSGEKGGQNRALFEILPDESEDEEEEEDEDDDFEETDDDDNDDDREKVLAFQKDTKLVEDIDLEGNDVLRSRNKSIEEENLPSPSPIEGGADNQSSDSLNMTSAHRPTSRRRFLFAPKSPKSQSYVFSLNNTSALNGTTTSDAAGNNINAPLEREKPREKRLTTMIRKMKASRRENKKSELSDTKNSEGVATTEMNIVDGALDEQDSSSDESSFDEEDNWSEEESNLFDDDIDQPINCSTLYSSLPKSFLDVPPDMYDYLDSDLVREIESQDISTYAWEHHLFVKGLLQLLAERDLIGVEDDVLDAHNVSKMGVLRKKDAKIGWRVKYVEVRKGNLTYFDNKGNEKGRTIHLRKRSCVCRITSNKEGGQDCVFELLVDGGRRLLWTAQSEEECQGWVRAINQAMIGEVDDSRDIPLDLTLYRNAVDDYQTIHSSLKDVHTRQDYLLAMNTLLYRQTSSSALRVPMKWIRSNYMKEESKEEPVKDNERIQLAVREFWNILCNTSVVLNGHLVEADGLYSGERVIGALSRCILELDKVENTKDFNQIFNSLKRSRKEGKYSITELEAVSYARNILNGAMRSSSKGDIEAAVEELFRNDDVAQAKLESSEPLHVYVSYAGDDFSESKPRPTEFVGWIETKSKKAKKWKMRYFVLSEGVMSFFERANPRPNRLSGQMVLRDAKFKILEGNILSIVAQNRERLLRFSDRGELLKLKSIMDEKGSNVDAFIEQDLEKNEEVQKDQEKREAQKDLEKAEVHTSDDEQMPQLPTNEEDLLTSRDQQTMTYGDENIANANGRSLGRVRGAGAKFLKKAALAKKRAKDRTGARMKSFRTGAGMFIRGKRGNSDSEGTIRRRPTNDMLITSTRNLNDLSEKREPTVQAVVEMNSTFKVVSNHTSTSPEHEEDILLIIRVKLYQAFLLSGGPQGRLACGDELLLMEFSAGEGVEDVQSEFFQPPTSL